MSWEHIAWGLVFAVGQSASATSLASRNVFPERVILPKSDPRSGFKAGDDLSQMREFIRMACRELGYPVPANIDQGLARQIHDSLQKPRGAKVNYAEVLAEVQTRESSFRGERFVRGENRPSRGRRGRVSKYAGRSAGLAGIGVILVDSAVHGQPPGMQQVAEVAIGAVPVVGPIYSTYVIADDIISDMRDRVLAEYEELERLQRDTDLAAWEATYAATNRALLEYTRQQRYPWEGNFSADLAAGNWRNVASINYDRIAYCVQQLAQVIHSRRLAMNSNIMRVMERSVNDTYDDCIHNRGKYHSDNPAERTFQPRAAPTAELRSHRPGLHEGSGDSHL